MQPTLYVTANYTSINGLVNVLIAKMKEEGVAATTPQQVDDVTSKLQTMLASLERAQSQDALVTMTQALKELLHSQTSHQERTMLLANRLLQE